MIDFQTFIRILIAKVLVHSQQEHRLYDDRDYWVLALIAAGEVTEENYREYMDDPLRILGATSPSRTDLRIPFVKEPTP